MFGTVLAQKACLCLEAPPPPSRFINTLQATCGRGLERKSKV